MRAFGGTHEGKQALLLGNGMSLLAASEQYIPEQVITVGLNQSHLLFPNPTYHLIVDENQWNLPGARQAFEALRHQLLELPTIPDKPGRPAWSQTPELGVVADVAGQGSVMYAALQLVAWMGFERIWICGMDQAGPKFTGQPASPQPALYQHVPADVRARVRVIEPTACKVFETCTWPWKE